MHACFCHAEIEEECFCGGFIEEDEEVYDNE